MKPVAGRLIGPEDDQPGAPPVAVIAWSLWRERLGGDASAVGKQLLINGKPFTIAGVAAPEFFGVRPQAPPAVFIPLHQVGRVDLNLYNDADTRFTGKDFYWLELMGRLQPGVTLPAAQAVLAGLFHPYVAETATNDTERANLPLLWLQEGASGVDALLPRILQISLHSDGDGGPDSHHRLREHRQPAALARFGQAARNGHPSEFGSEPGAGDAAAVNRERSAVAVCGAAAGIIVAALGIRSLTLLLANGREDFTLHAGLDWRVLGFTLLDRADSRYPLWPRPGHTGNPAERNTGVERNPHQCDPETYRPIRIAVWPEPRAGRFAGSRFRSLLVASAGLFIRTLGNLAFRGFGF